MESAREQGEFTSNTNELQITSLQVYSFQILLQTLFSKLVFSSLFLLVIVARSLCKVRRCSSVAQMYVARPN